MSVKEQTRFTLDNKIAIKAEQNIVHHQTWLLLLIDPIRMNEG